MYNEINLLFVSSYEEDKNGRKEKLIFSLLLMGCMITLVL